ncbi:MAG: formate dehydrogenase accessory sulfurtransferase FdhD [Gammaproteobacteria bacterium]|nr:formate dehydrogenase accessory sulfurtransferase FdhD [Gammaproteobacteria bacterium]
MNTLICPSPQQFPNLHISDAGLSSTTPVNAINELGEQQPVALVGERPLTIYLDKYEIVTLMTIGTHPELLTIGYLINQGLLDSLEQVRIVQVDWETESVAVVTNTPDADRRSLLEKRTITTGCGQGTVFGSMMDKIRSIQVQQQQFKQSDCYTLLRNIREYNQVYKEAGAVHGCALCQNGEILMFVEDVGRHNAVDAIAGYMLLEIIDGSDKVFYTTGRLTSEMVIKVSQMQIPLLLSRSGATQMGLDVARQAGVTLISRAKGKAFQVLNGSENIEFDAKPERAGTERTRVGQYVKSNLAVD